MSHSNKITKHLLEIDWNDIVSKTILFDDIFIELSENSAILAHWTHQLSKATLQNPAQAFLFEMQAATREVSILLSLGRIKPAAGSIRVIVENALYFVYFMDHPIELESLVSNSRYHISKKEIDIP